MSYGVVPTGFNRKPLPIILSELEQAMVAVFGPDVIQTSQSPLGQLNGLMADLLAQLWEFGEDAYQSYDPDQAEGLRLDTLARLRILARGAGEDDLSLRQAITNQGRARIDVQDILRAVDAVSGVTYTQMFINDTDSIDENGLAGHSIAVAVLGGDDDAIARTVRAYVVPGIGTSGNVRIDTNIDSVCRSTWIVRPVAVPIALDIEVIRRTDKMGCPPADLTAIAEGLVADMAGQRRLINGENVTAFAIRSAIECRWPNVEVVSVAGQRVGETAGALPTSIAFDEIASFALADITVSNAP